MKRAPLWGPFFAGYTALKVALLSVDSPAGQQLDNSSDARNSNA